MSDTEQPPGIDTLTLYGTPLPFDSSFLYLGIPFKPNDTIDTGKLIHIRTQKAISSMRTLNAIGLRPNGIGRLLASRLYRQFIRPKMEYGLAIHTYSNKQRLILDKAQSTCLRMIYGGSSRSSTNVMSHMANLPQMEDRVTILQAKFIVRSHSLPEDSLLHQLLSTMRKVRYRTRSWQGLRNNNSLWTHFLHSRFPESSKQLKHAIRLFLEQRLTTYKSRRNTKRLNACRPTLGIDPILWLPMSRVEQSRCIRWRLGWLPGGAPTQCPCCHIPKGTTKNHLIKCLNMHSRLQVETTIEDPLSYILNKLPRTKPKSSMTIQFWTTTWPIVCTILDDLEHIQHQDYPRRQVYAHSAPGTNLVQWLQKKAQQPSTTSAESSASTSH